MYSTWRLRIDMAWKPTRGAELGDESVQSLFISAIFRIELLQRTFEPQTGKDSGRAVTWANDEDDVLLPLCRQ